MTQGSKSRDAGTISPTMAILYHLLPSVFVYLSFVSAALIQDIVGPTGNILSQEYISNA